MKILFFLLITLFFATIGFAEVSHQSDETNKKIEKIEEKLDTTKEELTKYTQITEDTKERVGDISGSVDRFGVLVGLFGILMTVIVIFFSIRSTKEAKLEAKEEAQKLLKEWIEKEAKSVFEAKVNALSDELQVKGDEILKRIEEKANEQYDKREEDYKNWKLNLNPTQEEKDKFEQEERLIEGKREEDLTLKDYWIKIVNKLNRKDYDNALILTDKAMKITSNDIVKIVALLMGKGAILREQGKFDDAIDIYDNVIFTYKESNIDTLIELVAMAMLQKGKVFCRQGKYEEAIKVYDKLIFNYKDSKKERVIEDVKSAIQNKLELEIILDMPITSDRILVDNLTQSPKDRALIDMLFILQNAKVSLQEIEIKLWLEKYKDVKHSGWNFHELEKWIAKATYEEDVKTRIHDYISTFKTHLYRA